MGMLLLLLFRSPLLHIKQVEIQGNQLVSKREIIELASYHKGQSYFSIDEQQIRAKIAQVPEVQAVTVSTIFPNHLYIRVQEYPTVAYVKRPDQSMAPLLSSGMILKHRAQYSIMTELPVIPEIRLNQTLLRAIRQIANAPKPIRDSIMDIEQVPRKADQVVISTRNHHQIFIRSHEITKKIQLYSSFQKHPPGKLYLLTSVWFHED